MSDGERGPVCRVGLVGAGGVSKLHVEGIARHPDRMKIVALCDPDESNLKERAAECGSPATFTALDDMIANADLDVAIVCTPTHIRKDVLLPLIDAKIPALCEKPFSETYAEASEIERASREAGVPIAVNQNFRRNFPFAIAREILAHGELGKPLHMTQVAAAMRRDKGWRLERKRYVMAVMSIHWFDGYRFMLQDEPETVCCHAVNSPATPGGEDTAIAATLRFRRGTIVSLSESFSSFTKPRACALDCERGGLIMTNAGATEVREDGTTIEHKNDLDRCDGSYILLDDLARAASEGREPETSATDNLKTLRVMEAAYRSIDERREVRLEEIQ